jgi:RNase P/RNase MRP subunit p29
MFVLVESSGMFVLVKASGMFVLVEASGMFVLVESWGMFVLVEASGMFVLVDGSLHCSNIQQRSRKEQMEWIWWKIQINGQMTKINWEILHLVSAEVKFHKKKKKTEYQNMDAR